MALSKDNMRDMFWYMLLARRLDERAWVLHRQGKIAFHLSGIGHEAAQVGAAFAIRPGYDWVAPYYRDLALMLALGFPARGFLLALTGKQGDTTSGGRQPPGHWSMREKNVISHSAPVATQSVHASGIGLGIKLRKEDKVVLTTIGEGATSQGEWYEAVNWAAVHQLPVVFVVENNRYAISEQVTKQMAVKSAADKACGLGLDGVQVDGTDVFAVYETIHRAVENARKGKGPSVVETQVYRITPHSSDDDDRSYRTREEVEEHKKRDPLMLAQKTLESNGILTAHSIEEMEQKARAIIDEAVQNAWDAPYPPVEDGMHPVYVEEIREAIHA